MNSLTAAEKVDVSYRQIDFWIRQGYVKGGMPGSGNQRNITGAEFQVLRYMAFLVKAGMGAKFAAPLARQMADGKPVPLGPWWIGPLPPTSARWIAPVVESEVA